MMVSVGPAQYRSMIHWGTERHRRYLDRAVPTVGRGRFHVTMPVAGWVSLADVLEREAFDRWGRERASKLVGERSGTRAAVHSIHARLTTLLAHPALRGWAVMGYSNEYLCAWQDVENERWSLTPPSTNLTVMFVLEPSFSPVFVSTDDVEFRNGVTRWLPKPWADRHARLGLFSPEEHDGWSDVDETTAAGEAVGAVDEQRR